MAYCLERYHDELVADFQECYGLDLLGFAAELGGSRTTTTVMRLAILCEQLPRNSRVKRAISPALAWSDESYLLARCEYMLRVIQWMFSEDGGKGINRPQPMATPARIAEDTQQVESTDFALIDSVLGLGSSRLD